MDAVSAILVAANVGMFVLNLGSRYYGLAGLNAAAAVLCLLYFLL